MSQQVFDDSLVSDEIKNLFNSDNLQRFLSNIKIAENGCLEWTGAKTLGYGEFYAKMPDGVKKIRANRYALQLSSGGMSFPSKIYACHRCDNPACVNPQHLFHGTHQDNMDDKVAKNRAAISFGYAKANWDIVEDIRSSNLTNKELCEKHNLSKATVSEIRTGKTWKDEQREKAIVPTR